MNRKDDWCKVTVTPDTNRTVIVKYKNAPTNGIQIGLHVLEGKLRYENGKFLTKKGRNKTSRISHWKDF